MNKFPLLEHKLMNLQTNMQIDGLFNNFDYKKILSNNTHH